MIPKSLHEIVKGDLDILIADSVREGKTIEYKREVPSPTSDDQKVKILAGISAFANTVGGDFLFGVEAEDGVPMGLIGIPASEIDDAKQRLEGSMASGINPRITNYAFREVDVGSGRCVLLLRINRSWTNPHMVTYNNSFRFYGRNNSGKYPLDVSEVRRSMLLSEMGPNRARNFREERVFRIAANDAYLKLPDVGKYVIHLVPLQSITSEFSIDIKKAYQEQHRPSLNGYHFQHARINFDGILFHNSTPENENSGYLQWFRNGSIEYTFTHTLHPRLGKIVDGRGFEEDIIEVLQNSLGAMQNVGIVFPVYVFISMMGFNGYQLAYGTIHQRGGLGTTYDSNILVPEKEFVDSSVDIGKEMKGVFDIVWNSFGLRESSSYDASGQRIALS